MQIVFGVLAVGCLGVFFEMGMIAKQINVLSVRISAAFVSVASGAAALYFAYLIGTMSQSP